MTVHDDAVRHRETVLGLWAACQDRDWTRYADHFAPDLVCDIWQTRELVRGRADWVRFNAEYPGDWRIEVVRVVTDGDGAVSWVRVHVGDQHMTGVSFFTFAPDGRVSRIDDHWPEPYDPPAGREHLVERY